MRMKINVNLPCLSALLAAALLMSGCASQQYMGVSLKPGGADPAVQALAARASTGDKQAQYELGRWFEDSTDANGMKKAIKLYQIAATPRGGSRMMYTPGPSGVTTSVVSAGPRIEGHAAAKARLVESPYSFDDASNAGLKRLRTILQSCHMNEAGHRSCPTIRAEMLSQAVDYHVNFPLCLKRVKDTVKVEIDIDKYEDFYQFAAPVRDCMMKQPVQLYLDFSSNAAREIWLSAYIAGRYEHENTDALVSEIVASKTFKLKKWSVERSILGRALDTMDWPFFTVVSSGTGWRWWFYGCASVLREDFQPVSDFEVAICDVVYSVRITESLRKERL